jgi:hypothetical protein
LAAAIADPSVPLQARFYMKGRTLLPDYLVQMR